MIVGDNLDKEDFQRLTQLHMECLPESTFSLLGLSAVKAYYLMIGQSPSDWLFVSRVQSRVCGACVLSNDPNTLSRRILMFRPFSLGFSIIKTMMSSGELRRKLIKSIIDNANIPSEVQGLPELVQIFTDAEMRGNKIGARLIDRVEQQLTGKSYFLKTDDDSSNRAHDFYKRHEFKVMGTALYLGKKYRYYRKNVPSV